MEQELSVPQEVSKRSSARSTALLGFVLLAVIAVVGLFFFAITKNQIVTDKADIEAPSITIASEQGGVIQKIFVKEGDLVSSNASVAQVSDQILKTKDVGLVISAQNNVGKTVGVGESIVTVINPAQLRVVAHIDENSGLSDIHIGQSAVFTVDAFGSKKYSGIVEEVSSTSRQSGVVFNISDQREVRQFDVKIRFDVKQYPELKNGMSAKVTIYTN